MDAIQKVIMKVNGNILSSNPILQEKHYYTAKNKYTNVKQLRLSVAPSRSWRNEEQRKFLKNKEWRNIRRKILEKYDYTCTYCGYKAQKYMIIHHLDGDPTNNSESNLEVVCLDCNKILHCGLAAIKGEIKIFKSPGLSQVEIIQETRKLRNQGWPDEEIIQKLGLTHVNTDAVQLANKLLEGKKIYENFVGFIMKN